MIPHENVYRRPRAIQFPKRQKNRVVGPRPWAVGLEIPHDAAHHKFGPGTTVARVKHWAAVQKFHMSEEEAGEHHLQITGTQDRPAPGMHIGTLASCPECRVRFDLVPDERVNGAAA